MRLMSSILETFVASQVYATIDESGICQHACSADQPFSMCEIEASELHRFDPDAYTALMNIGVEREEVSIEDIREVGRRASLLGNVISQFGDGKNEFLYKYAMSARLNAPLIVSSSDPFNQLHQDCQKKFKNKIKQYP